MAEKVDVRVLVWSGAPVPLFHPSRSEVTETLENLTRHTRIQAMGDPKEHPFHCHHEKTVVIDGEVAFVGGIDMTSSAGDRYDVQAHHARRSIGWHDVGTRLRGPPWPMSTTTSAPGGASSPRSSCRPSPPRSRRATPPSRWCAPSRRTCTTPSPAGTSASSRATPGRCARPASSSTWRTSSCGHPSSSRSSPTSCATRPPPSSA